MSLSTSSDWIILFQASWDTAIKISLGALLGAIVGLEWVSGGTRPACARIY